MSRALVINTAFLGDVVFTLPLIEALGRAGWTVDLLARPRFGVLADGLPGFAEAITYDKRGDDRGVVDTLRMARRLRARQYALVLGAHPSIRSGLLARATGAPVRIGWGPVGYTTRVRRGPRFVEDALALAHAAGIAAPLVAPQLAGISVTRGATIGLVPGARWATKRWPTAHWQALAVALRQRGHHLLWVGGGEEAALAPSAPSDETSFGEALRPLAARLGTCAAVIGGDSGLLHLARASGAAVLMLFGPTAATRLPADPQRLGLVVPELACRPCSPHGPRRCPRKDLACLTQLTVSDVLDGLQRLLRR